MSKIYMARQPIFKKNNKLYGYELLYRKTENNFYEGVDDDQATASLIDDLFFMEFEDMTDGKFGFVNFSRNLLLDEVPKMLPNDLLVVEILERVTVDKEIINICKDLKAAGYTLAMDDFIFANPNPLYEELINVVDIVKVEYSSTNMSKQIQLINKYRGKISFLAERVETRQDYVAAQNLGYSLFQGYFFSKPVMHNAKNIGTLPGNLVAILNDLTAREPDMKELADKFRADVELSYKLLKLVNSIYYGVSYNIKSIHHALIQIGPKELSRWINIMIIKGIQNVENQELINTSLVRAKVLSLLAIKNSLKEKESDYFLVGLFSEIDILLNKDLKSILKKLPFNEEIKSALLGEKNTLRKALDMMTSFEKIECDLVDKYMSTIGITQEQFMHLYVEALKWRKTIPQNLRG